MIFNLLVSLFSFNLFCADAPETINPLALQRLLSDPGIEHSDGFLLFQDDKLTIEKFKGGKTKLIPLASITKSITSLAVMALIADGKLSSLDEPIFHWLPDWKEGLKAKVTVRHILSHTSGLLCKPGVAEGDWILGRQNDLISFARNLEIVDEPGKEFCYSNAAIQLLAPVIAACAGKPADQYVKERLFTPLGIRRIKWRHDKVGTPWLYAGISLRAHDLAKIGQLMLHKGKWGKRQLLPESLVNEFTSPTGKDGYTGLGWFMLRRKAEKNLIGFMNAGSIGTYLLIYPSQNLVIVRTKEIYDRYSEFNTLIELAEALLR